MYKASNYVNISIGVCCLIFQLGLFLIYNIKNNYKNTENKIYSRMLFSNNITLISFILLVASLYYDNKSLGTQFNKVALISAFSWAVFFALYILLITNEKNKKLVSYIRSNEKKLFRIIYLIVIVFGIIMFNLFVDPDNSPIEGAGFIFWDICILILLIFGVVLIVVNRKNTDKKKLLPFYMSLLVFLAVPIILIFFPDVSFGYIIFPVITHLMYHTIENPDIKLINELELAKNQSEKANRAKTDFLASMSHEIRTPLNAIVGLSQLAYESEDINDIHEDTADILLASQNLLDIVNGIMDINELDADNVDLINDNYNIRKVLDELSKMAIFRIGNKDIKLRCSFDEQLPEYLYGDRDKVKRIISNLLTNAVKYTDNGFIDFIVESSINNDKCNLKISIKDTGKGIDKNNIDKIFNKFYRDDIDKDSDISGTGLGLSITKSLVELMDGKIEVDSNLNLGSTFTVAFSQKIGNATES